MSSGKCRARNFRFYQKINICHEKKPAESIPDSTWLRYQFIHHDFKYSRHFFSLKTLLAFSTDFSVKQSIILHTRPNVHMLYTIPTLDQIAAGDQILWIIITDFLKWPIFPILSFSAPHDCHTNLNISIINIIFVKNEIAFQFSNSADALYPLDLA